jgi:arsenate reductase
MSTFTIYHNPDCGTSRNTLALLRAAGAEPVVVEYLKHPPDRATLLALVAQLGMPVRDLLRRKGTPYDPLGLDAPHWTDAQRIDQVLAHPILMNRPIVVAPRGVRLCRPSDLAVGLLPEGTQADLRKEDGTAFLSESAVDGTDPALAAALHAAGLPTDDLAEPGRQFFAYDALEGTRLGYGGIEALGADALLRSLVVLPAARRQGTGAGIVALLQRRAFDAGARRAWVLTTDAAAYFERAGYKVAARDAAPAAVLATRQASNLCPASATLLQRRLAL